MSTLARKDPDGRITAWECIGCGKIEAPQTCIGICQDRKAELVYATNYDETVAELARTQQALASAQSLIRRMAHTRPRDGQWEQTLRYFQAQAQAVLDQLADAS